MFKRKKMKSMYAKNNVVMFDSSDSAKFAIKEFLRNRKKRSVKTLNNYKIRIDFFFDVTVGKNINNVTWNDILSIERGHVIKYRNKLLEMNNSPQTVNQKLSTIKSLYKKGLKGFKNDIDISIDVLNIECEVVKSEDKKSWGTLSKDEIDNLLLFCSTRFKPRIQEMFYKTSFATGIRIGALSSITMENIICKEDSKTGKKVHTIIGYDKGRPLNEAISDSLHAELMEIAIGNRIFKIDTGTLRNTLKDFCKEYNIEDARNIVPHSIKKASVGFVNEMNGGDLYATSKHAKHSNIQTTQAHYIEMPSLCEQPSYTMFNSEQYCIDNLKDLSKEDLLRMIEKAGKPTIKKMMDIMESEKND